MEKDKIFFGPSGMTKTTASFIKTTVKNRLKVLEETLKNLQFYSVTISTLDGDSKRVIDTGTKAEDLEKIKEIVGEIAEAYGLSAWLGEAITAHDRLVSEARLYTLADYCRDSGNPYPESPTKGALWTEDDYIATFDIEKRAKYYSLQTRAQHIGMTVHKETDPVSKARLEALKAIQKPINKYSEAGHIVLEEKILNVPQEFIETLYEDLQGEQREFQKEFNSIRFEIQEAVRDHNQTILNEYEKQCNLYKTQRDKLIAATEARKNELLKEVGNYKIVIPKYLEKIFDKYKNVGTKKNNK